ncbi:MAG: GNAT family N-acetyltransferase [Nocardioides sp.]
MRPRSTAGLPVAFPTKAPADSLCSPTEVDPAFDDVGVAEAMVRRVLEDVSTDGTRRVVPWCGYVTWWIGRHPEYASTVYDAMAD